MKRRFLGIVLCFLSIFLMSHNSYAIQYNYGGVSGLQTSSGWYNADKNSWWNGTQIAGNSLYWSTDSQTANNHIGRHTRLVLNLYGNGIPANSIGTFGMKMCGVGYDTWSGFSSQVDSGKLTETVESLDGQCINIQATFYFPYNTTTFGLGPSNGQNMFYAGTQDISIVINPISYVQLKSEPTADQLNTIQQQLNNIYSMEQSNLQNLKNAVESSGASIQETIQDQNDKENEAVGNIDNQSTSDISGTEDANTTSLIGLFSSFVSALSSASATNCNINGDMGNVDLGTLNLCRDDPPAIVQIIGSIFLIVLFVPLAYFLVKRIISEIRSFTNG